MEAVMRMYFGFLAVLLAVVQVAAADDMKGMDMKDMPGMSSPSTAATPTAKPKVKKAIKKAMKKGAATAIPAAKPKVSQDPVSNTAANSVWVCPMGDYTGAKTADGKCPKCGMELVKQGSTAEKK